MSEKEVLEEKIKEKKDNEMKDYIDKKLDQEIVKQIKERQDFHKILHEGETQEEKHNHATHSSEAFCPECGDKNPDFKDNQLVCKNCKNPVGTKEEITSGKVKFCRHCGHNEALEKE
jgi:membrane protease subunit (stomatin/prohibitin family)